MSLADLGWNHFFHTQVLQMGETDLVPVRVMAVHRDRLYVAGPGFDQLIPRPHAPDRDEEDEPTVGDWLIIEPETGRPRRLLSRQSLFKRRAAGTGRRLQLIAANIDTLFIVTSCNQDFNVARLERYLALARQADVMPVVVLTKSDLTDRPEDRAREAANLVPGLMVECLDARAPSQVARLMAWCGQGRTVALLGSSGVGKTTLVNSLTGGSQLTTGAVRADDDKGRHTTTARALHRLPSGGWLIDTPGMRELQLADTKAGLDGLFADIITLTAQCRYADCRHEVEPGCAIKMAIETGAIDPGRLQRWRKLKAEELRNSEALHERRARERQFMRSARSMVKRRREMWQE
ncbi:MAG: ribosome small subunit-dependent GTPase A [Hyphomicrobiales bacterium]|nr:MAG: ribosome small subunit-dependent GTPase A [Hyphomicrobiales bacterium]